MKQPVNLSTKKLTEFTTKDTIYIRDNKDYTKPLLLCNFVSYNDKNSTVTGVVCTIDKGYERSLGQTITAKYYDCALYGSSVAGDMDMCYYHFFKTDLRALHPLEVHKKTGGELHIEEHPSYALASFSRVSGGKRCLFGTSIENSQTITLTIKKATHKRSLNNDWFHGGNDIVEVEMSSNQFNELITSFNKGEGVPVTLRYLNGEIYPYPSFRSKADAFQDEFAAKMHNIGVKLQMLTDVSERILKTKGTVKEAEKKEILAEIASLKMELVSNIPHISGQFNETLQKTVLEAKSEIENFIESKVRHLGLEQMQQIKDEYKPLLDSPM